MSNKTPQSDEEMSNDGSAQATPEQILGREMNKISSTAILALSSKGKSRSEIARLGGLARRGKYSVRRLKKIKIEEAVRQQIMNAADKLIRGQMISATGTHRIVVLSRDAEGKTHVETVRDVERIDALLATGVYGEEYLILAGKEPDWKAADALLNRALGKAKETVEHTGDVKFSLTALAKQRRTLPEPISVPYRELDTPLNDDGIVKK